MEFDNQTSNSNAPSPYVYQTAPTSPNGYNSMDVYYSAPASPQWKSGHHVVPLKTSDDNLGSNLNDFEFETSKRFSDPLHSDTSESPVGDHEARVRHRGRGDSLPSMAFADELFFNGLVMPLKLPPRLQCESEFTSFSLKSPVSSPRTPVCRISFGRKSSWNDDFDPFMVALEKVREEKRGRNGHHRRSRSYSPFRAISKGTDDNCNRDCPKGYSTMEPMQVAPPIYSGPLDFKGSAYARWVRDQTRHGLSPKSPTGFLFRQRVRPMKTEHGVLEKPSSPQGNRNRYGNGKLSKVQKLKGFLRRYASFGSSKTKKTTETRKWSHFGRSSFRKRTMTADTNLAVVQYKPPKALCLGYGVRSP